jgi:hypothetical protein
MRYTLSSAEIFKVHLSLLIKKLAQVSTSLQTAEMFIDDN